MQKGLVSRDTSPSAFVARNSVRNPCQNFRYVNLSWRRDLNPRPSDYKSDALPTELRQHWQTEQKYHTGNQIASNFLPAAKPLPDRHIRSAQGTPRALLLYS
jgi:hypothetical protein